MTYTPRYKSETILRILLALTDPLAELLFSLRILSTMWYRRESGWDMSGVAIATKLVAGRNGLVTAVGKIYAPGPGATW
jgi:hypothetical protein